MFACSICGRTYVRRTSLARHEHNHRKASQHVCSHCNIVFYRRDLLARHMKSHQPVSPSSGTDTEAFRRRESRQRCHTACLQCRELKVKCSGTVPCDNCTRLQKACRLTNSSSRLSHLTGLESTELGNRTHGADSASPSNPRFVRRESGSRDQVLPSPQRSDEHSFHDMISVTGEFTAQSVVNNEFSISGNLDSTVFDTNLLDPPMFSSLSWPWYHEMSYLPAAETLDTAYQDWESFQQADCGVPQYSSTSADIHIHNEQQVSTSMSSPPSERPQNDHLPTMLYSSKDTSETEAEQNSLLDEIMKYALSIRNDTGSNQEHSSAWSAFASRVSAAFRIQPDTEGQGAHILERFVHFYFENFDQLWPTFSQQNLFVNRLHPLLYVVLVSVGAMYDNDGAASHFGSKMHAKIQTCLIEPLELKDTEYDAAWLAQARCILRMAALYFGQSKAISHAHHLGYLLAAQVRRMDLFSASNAKATIEQLRKSDHSLTDQERLAIWLRLESRRRLAFGIFRSEAYTSLLFQSKPLFYLGEIDMSFPSCDAVWSGENMPASACLRLIDTDHTPGRDLYASDMYHIALDEDECLPPMGPLSHELVVLGLLYPTWEYSRTPALLSRLCGKDWTLADDLITARDDNPSSGLNRGVLPQSTDSITATIHHSSETRDYDQLECSTRRMRALHAGYRRLALALRKIERALPNVKMFARSHLDRTLLLSGLVTYHIIQLRLTAPASDLHGLQYALLDRRTFDPSSLAMIRKWTYSAHARFAAERSVSIWSLIANEHAKPIQERVRFNLVAFAGLHDAAVLLWSYASTIVDEAEHEPPLVLRSGNSEPDVVVKRSNTGTMLDSFSNLLNLLSPAKTSSFAQAIKGLRDVPFPHENDDI